MDKYETENINEHFNNNIICELDVKRMIRFLETIYEQN